MAEPNPGKTLAARENGTEKDPPGKEEGANWTRDKRMSAAMSAAEAWQPTPIDLPLGKKTSTKKRSMLEESADIFDGATMKLSQVIVRGGSGIDPSATEIPKFQSEWEAEYAEVSFSPKRLAHSVSSMTP